MSTPTAVVVGVGAERGLGGALCRRFAQGGYHVLVAGRTQAKIGRVAETIAAKGGSAEPIAMDATRESDVAGLFERAMAPGDGIDPTELVVSNAGNNQRIDFRELTSEQSRISGASAASAASWSGAKQRAGSCRSGAAASCSPVLRRAFAANLDLRILRQPKLACAWWRRAWRAIMGHSASM